MDIKDVRSIDILAITSAKLKNRDYEKSIPEYYRLETVTENGAWHANQNVLDHVISVFEELEGLLSFELVDSNRKQKAEEYLSQMIGQRSRKEILIVATLLHDIAKADTLVQRPDGSANCPGHELMATGMVKSFSQRFELSEKDETYVERIVRFHGYISDILTLTIANGQKEKYLSIFRETVGDVDLELVLLMRADLLGCDLDKSDKNGFDKRRDLLDEILNKLLSKV